MERAYIIGNGPSRKGVDLSKLPGKTFGCNALYRDFEPDYLLSGDAGIIKEICQSDYPKDRWCIFPDWSPIPKEYKDMMLSSFKGYEIHESDTERFDHVQIFGNEYEDLGKQVHILGVDPKWRIINMAGTDDDPEFAVNFFAGSNAMAQASIMGFEEVVLLGFDSIWNFNPDVYQNIYAGTDCYLREKETPRLGVGTDDPNSLSGSQDAQIRKVLDEFEFVRYYIDRGDGKLEPLKYDSFIR